MPSLNPYLTFDGNCEEVFNFYQSVFGGEFAHVARFNEMPDDVEGFPPVTDEVAEKIMHIALPISDECTLMGCDAMPGQPCDAGSNFAISINCDSREETEKFYNGLNIDGNIIMPLADTFWGDYFAMFVDKYGIQWMVSCECK